MNYLLTLFILFSALFQVVAAQGNSLGLFIIIMVAIGLCLAGGLWLVVACLIRFCFIGYIESPPSEFRPYRRSLGNQIGCSIIWFMLPCFGFMWIRKVRDVLPIKKCMQIVYYVSAVFGLLFIAMTIVLFTDALSYRFSETKLVESVSFNQKCINTCPAGLWMAHPTCFFSEKSLFYQPVVGETESTLTPITLTTSNRKSTTPTTPTSTTNTTFVATTETFSTESSSTETFSTETLSPETFSSSTETEIETTSTSTVETNDQTTTNSVEAITTTMDKPSFLTKSFFHGTDDFDQPLTLLSENPNGGSLWAAACFQQCLKPIDSLDELYAFWGDRKVPIARQFGFNSSHFERKSVGIEKSYYGAAAGKVGLFRSGNNELTLLLDGYAHVNLLGDVTMYVSDEPCVDAGVPDSLPPVWHADLQAEFQLTTNTAMQDAGYRHRVTAVAVATTDIPLPEESLSVVFTALVDGKLKPVACAKLAKPTEADNSQLDADGYWPDFSIYDLFVVNNIGTLLPAPLVPLPLPQDSDQQPFCDCHDVTPALRPRGYTQNEIQNFDTVPCEVEYATFFSEPQTARREIFLAFYVIVTIVGFILNCIFWIGAFRDLKGNNADFNELKSAE